MKFIFYIVFAAVLFISNDVSGQWLNANPGAGGQVQHVVCDPNITGRMYLCSDMEGYYVSDDFGDHWTYKGWEAPFSFIFNLAVEPGNSQRLYLTSSQGLAISDNAGASWKIVEQFDDMSMATISINPKNKNWICVAESWLETVIGNKKGAGKIYFSKNRGETWQSSTFLNSSSDKNIFSINFHPADNKNDVLVAIGDGIFVSNDGFSSWQKMPNPTNVKACQGCDFTPDGKWLYAVYIRDDNSTGVYVKKYDGGEWLELDPAGFLQQLNQTHWRPKVWPGSTERKHYVLFGPLKAAGNYNDNGLNEGRFLVEGDKIIGHVSQILKVQNDNEPFDVGWNAYWSHCRTYDYYPKNWEVKGINRGVFTMCSQSAFRGDAAKPYEWVVNTCHLYKTESQTKFYRTNGTASTWVWDIAGIDNYVVMGMGDNGVAESWDNGFSWTQKFNPNMWNVDALEIVNGKKKIALAGRSDGFGGALFENKGRLYFREIDTQKPTSGWKVLIDGKTTNLKGLNPALNRIATIQSDPHKPERIYMGTNHGLYVCDNIFELINNNPEFNFKSISAPEIGSTLTRRVHVDPNNADRLYLRCWKGTYRAEKRENGTWDFNRLKVNGSSEYLNDGWGHNGDISVWAKDSITTCLLVSRNVNPDRELWISFDKGESFRKIMDKDKAFAIRPPENNWYSKQSPVIYGGLCGTDSLLFTTVHLRGGGEGLTKGISILKGTLQPDSTILWEDFTGDPHNGGNWFPAARSGKIWKDGSGNPAIHLASMGAGMWKRSLVDSEKAKAAFTSDVKSGNLPLSVNFDASASVSSENAAKIVAYDWDFGDGETGSGVGVSHKFVQKKAHTVQLKVTDDKGNSACAYQNIEAKVYAPVADFVISTYRGKTNNEIQFYGELSYDENPADSIIYYQWDFKDGGTAYGKNVSHIYERQGRFSVKLTVRNTAFKSASLTKSIIVELNTNAEKKYESDIIRMYPNPVKNKLTVNLPAQEGVNVVVLNAMGEKVLTQRNVFGIQKFDFSRLNSGIYFLAIQNKNAFKKQTFKIVKH